MPRKDHQDSSLKRVPSGALKNIKKRIFVVDEDKELRPLEQIDSVDSFAKGSQSRVWLVVSEFMVNGKKEVRHQVLKEMPKVPRRLSGKSDSLSEDDSDTDTVLPETPVPFEAHERITRGVDTSTRHNIIQLIEVIKTDSGKSYALLPFCPFFLDDLLKTFSTLDDDPVLKLAIIVDVMVDLLEALRHLHHDRGYIHGDINLFNIAWYNGKFCFIDLDCAKRIGATVTETSCSLYYLHPAAHYNLKLYGADPCNDYWALGKVLLQLLEQAMPKMPNAAVFMHEQASAFEAALNERERLKAENALPPWSTLKETLSGITSIERELLCIAEHLTAILPTQQPGVLELIEVFQEKQGLFCGGKSADAAELRVARDTFYQALDVKSKEIFPDESLGLGTSQLESIEGITPSMTHGYRSSDSLSTNSNGFLTPSRHDRANSNPNSDDFPEPEGSDTVEPSKR